MLRSLVALAPAPSGWEAALTWLSRPQDPQLRLLLALCAAAALGGLVERWRARRAKPKTPSEASRRTNLPSKSPAAPSQKEA